MPGKKSPVFDLHPEKEQDKAKSNDICSDDRIRIDPDPVRCPQEHPCSKEQEHCKREVLGFLEFQVRSTCGTNEMVVRVPAI